MIKYIGSKRTLVPLIKSVVAQLPGRAPPATSSPARPASGRRCAASGSRPLERSRDLLRGARAGLHRRRDETLDRERLAAILAELSALEGRDGYFTEAFCRRARYFQPENGARIDAIRDAIDGYELPAVERGVLLTSLLEAADRVDSTTGLQMAYLKAWAPRSYNDARAAAARAGRRARAGTRVPARRERARAAARRRPRLRRPAVQPALVLLQLPRVGDPRALGRAGDLRRREQARRLPRAAERLQLEARGAGARSPSCSRRSARRGCSSRCPTRASTMPPSSSGCSPELGYVGRIDVDSKRYVGAQIGIYNPSGEKVGTDLAPAEPRDPLARRARPRCSSSRRRAPGASAEACAGGEEDRGDPGGGGERQERRGRRAEPGRGDAARAPAIAAGQGPRPRR